ncbi:MAG: hypothetical protein OEL84_12050 [Nitrosopumilus sp.]|nr:hypothetical protein [Nitrosopumilus sp.]
MITKNDNTSQTTILSANKDLLDIMEQSFKFWHENYTNSLVNYSLVWKKALESDSEIVEKIETWKEKSNQNTRIIIEQFFEMWSYAIRKSNFEIARKSIQEWEGFWKNATGEQFRVCSEILQMIETYWKEIQNKNIE